MENQEQQFLKDLKTDEVKLENLSDLITPPLKPEEGKPEKDERPPNRQVRRLQEKLQSEREANIALNERIKALSELREYAESHKEEIDPDMIRLFGTTEEGKQAISIFDKKFKELEERAQERAYERFSQEKEQQFKAEKANSAHIDEGFNQIEEELNVDLSGETKASRELRNGFIDFLTEISPKDEHGEIIDYADFVPSFRAFQRINGKSRETSDRQKELASRTMTPSGSQIEDSPQGPITFKTASRYLDSLRDRFGNV